MKEQTTSATYLSPGLLLLLCTAAIAVIFTAIFIISISIAIVAVSIFVTSTANFAQ
jgi:hypothetical protein